MTDDSTKDPAEALKEALKARALEDFERKWAALKRAAGDLGMPVTALGGARPADEPSPAPTILKTPHHSGGGFDGTVGSLIDFYESHPDSRFQKVAYRTREHYQSLLKTIRQDLGSNPVFTLDAEKITNTYLAWTLRGNAMAKALITMLRGLSAFGTTVLKDQSCRILRVTLHDMDFSSAGEKRTERLSEIQAIKIRTIAHEWGLHSIALAQAIQFQTPFRQRDVIGEWVPISEPGAPSDVIDGNNKWLRGLLWSEIDGSVITHTSARRSTPIAFDLRNAWMVREEFARLGHDRPTTRTPVIVHEKTGLPYIAWNFRRQWRDIARAAGVPDHIMNMDSYIRRSDRAQDDDAGKETSDSRN
jgi:hypothetical protein